MNTLSICALSIFGICVVAFALFTAIAIEKHVSARIHEARIESAATKIASAGERIHRGQARFEDAYTLVLQQANEIKLGDQTDSMAESMVEKIEAMKDQAVTQLKSATDLPPKKITVAEYGQKWASYKKLGNQYIALSNKVMNESQNAAKIAVKSATLAMLDRAGQDARKAVEKADLSGKNVERAASLWKTFQANLDSSNPQAAYQHLQQYAALSGDEKLNQQIAKIGQSPDNGTHQPERKYAIALPQQSSGFHFGDFMMGAMALHMLTGNPTSDFVSSDSRSSYAARRAGSETPTRATSSMRSSRNPSRRSSRYGSSRTGSTRSSYRSTSRMSSYRSSSTRR